MLNAVRPRLFSGTLPTLCRGTGLLLVLSGLASSSGCADQRVASSFAQAQAELVAKRAAEQGGTQAGGQASGTGEFAGGVAPGQTTSPTSQTNAATLSSGAGSSNGSFPIARGGKNSSSGQGTSQSTGWAPIGATDTPMDTAPDGLVQVTRPAEGADFDPVISRDGTFIVFASTQHRRTADLYMRQLGSSVMVQLTQDSSNDIMPAISPDGQKIVFCSDRAGAGVIPGSGPSTAAAFAPLASSNGGSYGLYMMSIKGGQPVQLTSGFTDLHPSFSPDGQRIAFCRYGEVSARWELWVLDIKRPASPEFIGYGMFPKFSPVGGTGVAGADRLLFQRARQRGDQAYSVWTIDYKPGSTGNPTQVIAAEGRAAISPTWSADGQWIAYTSAVVNPLGPGYPVQAPISPRHGYGVPNANGGGSGGGSGQSQSGEIYLTSADGAMTINLTGSMGRAFMPTWGADGRVYFVSDRSGTMGIWSVSTEKALAAASGGSQRPITKGTGAEGGAQPMAGAPGE